MNRHQLGRWGEKKAAEYLEERGYNLLTQNYSLQLGEIDLIACKKEVIIFIEVKTRSSDYFGPPQSAVNFQKQNQLRKLAFCYLKENRQYDNFKKRFDVLAVRVRKNNCRGESQNGSYYNIEHLKNAF